MFDTFDFMAFNWCGILGGPYYPTLPYRWVNLVGLLAIGTPTSALCAVERCQCVTTMYITCTIFSFCTRFFSMFGHDL